MSLFQPAAKEQLKARVAIDGPTGSGKTWTALQWARIIAGPDGPIGLVDTENRSAAYYAPTPGQPTERLNWWDPPYEFGHLPVTPPYDPRQLAQLIDKAGEELGPNGVLIIDSLTHYWNGEGGTLDIVDHADSRNKFAGWKEGTPAQRMMLDRIIHARCHVIVTMRSKMEYVLTEVVRNGRTIQQPTKLGMAPEQRAGVEYEFTVVADMDLEHRLVVSKSRCDAIADAVATKGRSAEVAQTFAGWLGTGVEPPPPPSPPVDGPTAHQTRHVMALFGELEVTDRVERLKRTSKIVGRTVGSWNDVTADEAEQVIATLRRERNENPPPPEDPS